MVNDDATPTCAAEGSRFQATRVEASINNALNVIKIGRRALANGLLCRFDPHWIAFGPALVVTAEQLDDMLALLDKSMGEVLSD